MDQYEISSDEKTFIIGGIEADIRNDGRERLQYRPLNIQVDCIKRAMGSARVKIGENIVIATIKGDLRTPSKELPNQGSVDFQIECSAEAKPRLESHRKMGNEGGWNSRMYWMIKEGYKGLGLGSLVVVEGVRVWHLEASVLVVATGGAGLPDVISFALRSAFATLHLPVVKAVNRDADDYEIKIDEYSSYTPKLENVPNIITLCKIGGCYVVDPTYEESLCSELNFVVSVNSDGKIVSIFQEGCGCIHPSSLQENFEVLVKISKYLETEMNKALNFQTGTVAES